MPRKYSMDMRSEVAALRRQRFIEATVEVLGEVGADRLTMDMVAERADAATRTIYNYFPTRQDLLSAVQSELLQAFRDTLQLEIPGTGEPAERLRQFVAVLFDMYEQQGAALTTLLEFDEPDIRAQVRDMRAWRRDRLEEILRSASGTTLRLPSRSGRCLRVRDDQPRLVARAPGRTWPDAGPGRRNDRHRDRSRIVPRK